MSAEALRIGIDDQLRRKIIFLEHGDRALMIADVRIDVRVRAHNDMRPIFFAGREHKFCLLPRARTRAVRFIRVIVELEQDVVSGGSLRDAIEVNGISRIVGMPDDVDARIFDRADHCGSVLLESAGLNAGIMQRGDGEIERLENVPRQIGRAVVVENVELDAKHQINPVGVSTNRFEIKEMEIMTRAGHGGRVIRNAEELQIFIFRGGDHLIHRVVGVTAGKRVCVDVENINQIISSFDGFADNYIIQKLPDQIICDRMSPKKVLK